LNAHDLRKTRLQREWRLTAAIAFIFLAFLVFAEIAGPLGNVLYDHLMRLHGFRATQNIVIVAVDDRSLQELGGWPLQRGQYTKLLERLTQPCCHPKVIGLDFLFLDPTPDDQELGAQLKKAPSALPLAFKVDEVSPHNIQAIQPVSPLAESVNLGHINLSFDSDGVIRGFNTYEQQWPHFSIALHQLGDQTKSLHPTSDVYRRFRMVDPSIGFPMISLADALESNASRSLLKDKYVLVGVTAPSLGDRYPTLYSGKNNASTPGVAILASVLNASLNNALIRVASPWVIFSITLVPLLVMLQSLVLLTPRRALMLAVAMILGSIAASYTLLTFADYWIDPIPFVLMAVLIQPLWAWRRLEAIVHLVEDKAADLQQFQPAERIKSKASPSREVVLRYAKLLDQAVASAKSELDFLAAVVNEMPDGVVIFDTQDQLLLSNQKVFELFNVSQHSGYSLNDFVTHLDLPISLITQDILHPQPNTQQIVVQLSTSIGPRDFVIKNASLDSPLGKNLRLIILMDITELRQSQTQRDRALQFLSHDMRTPIASILALTRRTTNLTDDGLQQEKIILHAQALLHMMDDFILTISSEASQYKVQLELLDNLLNDSIGQVIDLADEKRIQLLDQSDTSNVFINANTRLLVRAFVNLLFNAIKFSPSHSTITVNTSCQQQTTATPAQVTITITNEVDAAIRSLDLIPSMPGFGLGLDFVDNVIQKHHGTILRNIPGSGLASVQLNFPCEIS
jgi:CHASE2 domain-containing sensor protein/nitrogen-specific signal transduction histidine kinase